MIYLLQIRFLLALVNVILCFKKEISEQIDIFFECGVSERNIFCNFAAN